MMRELFLHAGPAKTGTSTIQAFLFANSDLLSRAGLYVPAPERADTKGNHGHLLFELGQSPPHLLRPPRTLAGELRDHGMPSKVILSSEAYEPRLMVPALAKAISEHVARLGYRLRVISYVRPQMALANSHFAQSTTTLRPLPLFDSYLTPWFAAWHVHNHLWRHRRLAEAGIETMHIPYTSALRKGGIGEDLLQRLGVAETAIAACGTVPDQNQSPGPKAIAAMHAIATGAADEISRAAPAKVVAAAQQLKQLIAEKGWNRGHFQALTEDDKHRIQSAFAPSNRNFANAAWRLNWPDTFGDDEANFLARPQSVFVPCHAERAERDEFEDFCRAAMEFVKTFLSAG